MEEMETDGLIPDDIYRPGDVVWVKISGMWWPAEVKDQATLDPEITEGLKKQPLAVVQFLKEDTYEHIKSLDNIYHYVCKRKEEFLKLGFKKYYRLKNEKNMAMYPEAIQEAEKRTGGDPEIIHDPNILPQEAQEPKMENGGRSSLPANFKVKKGTAPRRSAPAQSYDGDSDADNVVGPIKLEKQGPTWYPYPEHILYVSSGRRAPKDDLSAVVLHRCSLCCFETTNFEILLLHHKYNQHNTTLMQPNKYHWRNPLNRSDRKMKSGSGIKKTIVRKKKDSVKPLEKKSRKSKKASTSVPAVACTPPKKSQLSSLSTGTPSALDVSQTCAKIIEEWTDDEDENKTIDATTGNDIDWSASTNDNTMEVTTEIDEPSKDIEKQTGQDASPSKTEKPPAPPKAASCFDFDDEELAEPDLQSLKFGQKLPRVITPEKSKPPDPMGDGDNIEDLLKEVSVPDIPTLPPSKQDSHYSRGDRTYGSSPFKEAKKSDASPEKAKVDGDANADSENNKHEEKHFLAEGPLQSKKRKSSGRTEGAEDGSAFNKKSKMGASPKKPSNKEVEANESSNIAAKSTAAELAKQSLIDTLTYSPKSDEELINVADNPAQIQSTTEAENKIQTPEKVESASKPTEPPKSKSLAQPVSSTRYGRRRSQIGATSESKPFEESTPRSLRHRRRSSDKWTAEIERKKSHEHSEVSLNDSAKEEPSLDNQDEGKFVESPSSLDKHKKKKIPISPPSSLEKQSLNDNVLETQVGGQSVEEVPEETKLSPPPSKKSGRNKKRLSAGEHVQNDEMVELPALEPPVKSPSGRQSKRGKFDHSHDMTEQVKLTETVEPNKMNATTNSTHCADAAELVKLPSIPSRRSIRNRSLQSGDVVESMKSPRNDSEDLTTISDSEVRSPSSSVKKSKRNKSLPHGSTESSPSADDTSKAAPLECDDQQKANEATSINIIVPKEFDQQTAQEAADPKASDKTHEKKGVDQLSSPEKVDAKSPKSSRKSERSMAGCALTSKAETKKLAEGVDQKTENAEASELKSPVPCRRSTRNKSIHSEETSEAIHFPKEKMQVSVVLERMANEADMETLSLPQVETSKTEASPEVLEQAGASRKSKKFKSSEETPDLDSIKPEDPTSSKSKKNDTVLSEQPSDSTRMKETEIFHSKDLEPVKSLEETPKPEISTVVNSLGIDMQPESGSIAIDSSLENAFGSTLEKVEVAEIGNSKETVESPRRSKRNQPAQEVPLTERVPEVAKAVSGEISKDVVAKCETGAPIPSSEDVPELTKDLISEMEADKDSAATVDKVGSPMKQTIIGNDSVSLEPVSPLQPESASNDIDKRRIPEQESPVKAQINNAVVEPLEAKQDQPVFEPTVTPEFPSPTLDGKSGVTKTNCKDMSLESSKLKKETQSDNKKKDSDSSHPSSRELRKSQEMKRSSRELRESSSREDSSKKRGGDRRKSEEVTKPKRQEKSREPKSLLKEKGGKESVEKENSSKERHHSRRSKKETPVDKQPVEEKIDGSSHRRSSRRSAHMPSEPTVTSRKSFTAIGGTEEVGESMAKDSKTPEKTHTEKTVSPRKPGEHPSSVAELELSRIDAIKDAIQNKSEAAAPVESATEKGVKETGAANDQPFKPLEVDVTDITKTADLGPSLKKQMAHSPSKTFRQDDAELLLQELLGSPKSSPASSPTKAKADSPVKPESPRRSGRFKDADLKFSLTPSKVLDFGSPSKVVDVAPQLTPSKTPESVLSDLSAVPARTSRWDSPYRSVKSPTQLLSPTKTSRSPGSKLKVEILSGSRVKPSPPEKSVSSFPQVLEPDPANHQSDDELSALQAEIMSYSAMDKTNATGEGKNEVLSVPNSSLLGTSAKSSQSKGKCELGNSIGNTAMPPTTPSKPTGLNVAAELANMLRDDTEPARSVASDVVSDVSKTPVDVPGNVQGTFGSSELLDIISMPIIFASDEESLLPAGNEAISSSSAVVPLEVIPSATLQSTESVKDKNTSEPPETEVPVPAPEPVVESTSLLPEKSVDVPTQELIETEIIMDHSETELQTFETLEQCPDASRPSWLRPDIQEILTKDAVEKKVYRAKRVKQLVIGIYDEDHPEYSHYMSLPPCTVGTSNFKESWAETPKPIMTTLKPAQSSQENLVKIAVPPPSTNQVKVLPRPCLTMAHPETVGAEVVMGSSAKNSPIRILNVVRPGLSPTRPAAKMKQDLMQNLVKLKAGHLDPQTKNKLAGLAKDMELLAKLQPKTVQNVGDVKVVPKSVLVSATNIPIMRASPAKTIVIPTTGTQVLAKNVIASSVTAQPKNILVATACGQGISQPKNKVVVGNQQIKFTIQPTNSVQVGSPTPKFVVTREQPIVIGRNTGKTAQTAAGPSTIKVAHALPERPLIVQCVKKTVPAQARPSKVPIQARTVRPAKEFTYVSLANQYVPTSDKKMYVISGTKPAPSVVPGSDILAEALGNIGILPSDSEPFTEEPSTDLFSPNSVVIAGSLGADQLSNVSLESDR